MAFLEVLTRCHKRPVMQAINRESLEVQTCDDWSQTLFIDDDGIGMAEAQEQFSGYTPDGEYVWILDDDDMVASHTLVEELSTIAFKHSPDVIMIRMDHGPRGILPDKQSWGDRPREARIGCSAFVVSRQMWQLFKWAWKPGSYKSDYHFISAVWDCKPRVIWHDVIGSKVQRISLGEPE